MNFTIQKTSAGSKARAAVFQTLHGEVQTPVFMPVGTQATVKVQSVDSLKITGSRVLLANTYNLLLGPGPEVFRKLGGALCSLEHTADPAIDAVLRQHLGYLIPSWVCVLLQRIDLDRDGHRRSLFSVGEPCPLEVLF